MLNVHICSEDILLKGETDGQYLCACGINLDNIFTGVEISLSLSINQTFEILKTASTLEDHEYQKGYS